MISPYFMREKKGDTTPILAYFLWIQSKHFECDLNSPQVGEMVYTPPLWVFSSPSLKKGNLELENHIEIHEKIFIIHRSGHIKGTVLSVFDNQIWTYDSIIKGQPKAIIMLKIQTNSPGVLFFSFYSELFSPLVSEIILVIV